MKTGPISGERGAFGEGARGLASRGCDQGRYAADGADSWFSESAFPRFHCQVLDALQDED